jgi:hypothetical protein
MNRHQQQTNERYEALLFARTPEEGNRAALELIRAVLGEDGLKLNPEEALRATCRKLRPSRDPREQERFEAEFIELAQWPARSREMVAA